MKIFEIFLNSFEVSFIFHIDSLLKSYPDFSSSYLAICNYFIYLGIKLDLFLLLLQLSNTIFFCTIIYSYMWIFESWMKRIWNNFSFLKTLFQTGYYRITFWIRLFLRIGFHTKLICNSLTLLKSQDNGNKPFYLVRAVIFLIKAIV